MKDRKESERKRIPPGSSPVVLPWLTSQDLIDHVVKVSKLDAKILCQCADRFLKTFL